jgi:predicted amidohydrolase
MNTLRVAAVSMIGYLGQPDRALQAIDVWCERAKQAAVEIVLFPELVIHGHCTPNTWELAEPAPDGPSVEKLVEIARRHQLVLCAGLSEKERDNVYNTQVLVGPHGYVGKQRKLHLSRDETLASDATAGAIWRALARTGQLLAGGTNYVGGFTCGFPISRSRRQSVRPRYW